MTVIPKSLALANHDLTPLVGSLTSQPTSVLSKSVMIPLTPLSASFSISISNIDFTYAFGINNFFMIPTIFSPLPL